MWKWYKRNLYGGNGHLLAHQRAALLGQPFAVQKLAIEREERHLQSRFGKDLCGLRRACAAVDLGSCVALLRFL